MTQRIPVYILLGPLPLMLDFAGPAEALRHVNAIQSDFYFDVKFIGRHSALVTSIGLSLTGINPLPDHLEKNALLIVSGNTSHLKGFGTTPETSQMQSDERALITWLAGLDIKTQTLMTICSGALLAARAGLFNGYRCTTHFDCLEELKAINATIKIEENCLFTEDRNRLASAGVTSGTDLTLHLISKWVGISAAAQVAQHMVVYLRRSGNSPQLSPFLSGRSHVHPTIHRIQDLIAADPAQPWNVENLATHAFMSARHFSRLFNAQTGYSVPDYVNGLRIAIAENLLQAKPIQIEQLVDHLGFQSARHFRRAWQKHHQLSPTEWRKTRTQNQ